MRFVCIDRILAKYIKMLWSDSSAFCFLKKSIHFVHALLVVLLCRAYARYALDIFWQAHPLTGPLAEEENQHEPTVGGTAHELGKQGKRNHRAARKGKLQIHVCKVYPI